MKTQRVLRVRERVCVQTECLRAGTAVPCALGLVRVVFVTPELSVDAQRIGIDGCDVTFLIIVVVVSVVEEAKPFVVRMEEVTVNGVESVDLETEMIVAKDLRARCASFAVIAHKNGAFVGVGTKHFALAENDEKCEEIRAQFGL